MLRNWHPFFFVSFEILHFNNFLYKICLTLLSQLIFSSMNTFLSRLGLLFSIPFILTIQSSYAQNCGCTHTLTTASNAITFDGGGYTANPRVKPGDVICIPTGTRGRIIVKNIVGTLSNPVIIKNCGGTAIIDAGTATGHAFLMQYSKFFKITGTGDANTLYGIKVVKGQNGLVLSERCTNFEIDHVEISKSGFAGIMAKTDPTCADTMTFRKNFTMYNISLHHNYVHDVDGEGFYIGNSFYNTTAPGTASCGGQAPHSIDGVDVYRNIVKRTGCEGIQVGSALRNSKIHDNTIDTTGLNPFASFQNNGIQMGSGTGGLCYNNWMNFCPGNGIVCTGIGDNIIYNNIIINPGADTAKLGFGIFMDEQNTNASIIGNGMAFINNTVINPRENGIRIYTDRLPQSYILNNLIVQYGTAPGYVRKLNNSVNVDQRGNVFLNTLSAAGFVNPSIKDYRLKSGSPAIGVGVNVTSFGVLFDFNNYTRKTPFDAGAFAYTVPGIPLSLGSSDLKSDSLLDSKQVLFVYPNPQTEPNNETTFRFFIKAKAEIEIHSYDFDGKLLEIISPSVFNTGWNEIKINNLKLGAAVFSLMENGKKLDSQIIITR